MSGLTQPVSRTAPELDRAGGAALDPAGGAVVHHGGGPALDNRRVAAALIDLLVLFAGGLAFGALFGGAGPWTGALAVAWTLYYFLACESGGGQTLGKRVMGIRVVSADGGEPGMRQIAVRTVLRVVDGVGLYLVGAVVMLLSGGRRQRLGDMAAGTVVARASDVPAGTSRLPAATAAAEREVEPPADSPARADSPVEEFHVEPMAEPDPPAAEPRVEIISAREPDREPPAVQPRVEVLREPDVPDEAPPGPVRGVEILSAIDLVMADEDEGHGRPPSSGERG